MIAQVHGLIEVVGNEDDGLIESALQLEKLILHFATNKRIKGRKKASSMSRMSVSAASARARPTRCCMPPES
ncbi:hypothetical protein JCM18916_905 [Cutibacterium acnes JCM 18916]|nr:hypothetical protein JCM18916_905 [Cutibacterium acnes JCM 18916]GAE75244.1 hypothetical protein JCM18918_941 [Cutibacterium acnes JCM 18918]